MDFNLKYLRSQIKNTKPCIHLELHSGFVRLESIKKTLSHESKSPDFIFHRQIGCFASVTHTCVQRRNIATSVILQLVHCGPEGLGTL